MRVPLAKYCA